MMKTLYFALHPVIESSSTISIEKDAWELILKKTDREQLANAIALFGRTVNPDIDWKDSVGSCEWEENSDTAISELTIRVLSDFGIEMSDGKLTQTFSISQEGRLIQTSQHGHENVARYCPHCGCRRIATLVDGSGFECRNCQTMFNFVGE